MAGIGKYKRKAKGKRGFRMRSPLRQESTKEMIQNLDDKIAELKKLGKHNAAQVFIDKKSKLMDSMGKSSIATKKYKY